MKKYLIIAISLLLSAAGRSESEMSPGPTPPEITSENLLSWILSDENHKEYHTSESTIEEFNRLVGECINTEGRIMEGTEELSIGLIEWFIPQLLAEHFELKDRGPDAVIEKFGRPVRILRVRKNAPSESSILMGVPAGWICGSTEDGRPIGGGYWAPVECYEYHQYLVWITSRDASAEIVDRVMSVSPRSPLYDRYIAEKDLFE